MERSDRLKSVVERLVSSGCTLTTSEDKELKVALDEKTNKVYISTKSGVRMKEKSHQIGLSSTPRDTFPNIDSISYKKDNPDDSLKAEVLLSDGTRYIIFTDTPISERYATILEKGENVQL